MRRRYLEADSRKQIAEIQTSLISALSYLLSAIVSLAPAREINFGELKVPTRVMNEIEYVPLTQLVTALGGNVWQVVDKFIAILPPQQDKGLATLAKGCELVFTMGKNQVLVNNRRVNLPVPFRLLDSEIFVPAALVNEIFPVRLSRMPKVLAFSLSHLRDTTVMRVETDTFAYCSSIAVTSTLFRIYLQADCKIRRLDATGVVRDVQVKGGSQGASESGSQGTELLVSTFQPCHCRTSRIGSSVALKFTPRPQRKISTVVIDPGHGGKDPGATGRRLKEKDMNLDLALRVKRRLNQLTSADIVLTRSRDDQKGLSERAQRANASRGDLFLSIHCNASPDAPSAQGIETFFLSAARNDWERAVASRENSALDFPVQDTNKGAADMVGNILRDLAQNEFLRESEDLASAVQAALASSLHGKDRGVKQADFAVLRGAYMPAALVECGFITNAAEEKLLGAGDYRERIASAIALGVVQFINRVESRTK